MRITVESLKNRNWLYVAHLNMGPKGYGYKYSCEAFPRLSFIDRTYKKERRTEREWYVDGQRVDTIEAAAAALNSPPILTPEETEALEKIPRELAVDLRHMEDVLAGCRRPEGAIMPDTPHSRATRIISGLREKGVVKFGKRPWPATYKPENTLADHRWSPTIQRCD